MAHRSHPARTALTAASAILGLIIGSACGPDQDGREPMGASTTPSAHGPLFSLNRAMRIGVKTDQPGIGLADSTGGNNTGLDIDIAKEIAKALRNRPVFQSVVSYNREEMITSGAVDLVVASYSITESRLAKVAFAGPYLIAGQDVLVRTADASVYTSVDNLREKKICIVAASTGYQHLADRFSAAWAAEHLVTKLDGRPILGYQTCVDLLVGGKVDAVSTDDVVLAGYANDDRYRGRVRLIGERLSREKYGIGLAKGNPADTALINRTLSEMIKDGRWAAILRKNLGVTASAFLRPENVPTPPVA